MLDAFLTLAWLVIKILALLLVVILSVAYLTYAERKVIGYMQGRLGPNRVGFKGLLQPFADVLKMLQKEMLVPTASSRFLFCIAPIISLGTALSAWAVIPVNADWVIANVNLGLLYVLAMTSLGVYGVLISGWASNSKYAMYGAIRASAQTISYEIAMGIALIGVMMAANSLNLSDIVNAQAGGVWHWYCLPLLPLAVVYWIAGVAETNRAPFDVAEGESELVAGFHVEYSGIRFASFFLAEYANMILVASLATLLFFGGWLSPFQPMSYLGKFFVFVPGLLWFLMKMACLLLVYLWMRATFPRYRYDQIMTLGWKVLIPVSFIWLIVVAILIECKIGPWFI